MEIPVPEILDSLRDAVVTMDAEWRVTYLNRAAAAFAGRPVAELVGKSCWEIFPDGPGKPFDLEMKRASARRRPGRFEGYCASVDRWLESDMHPTANGMLVITRDVTAARRREREAEERLQLALSFGSAGIWERDLKTWVVRCSPEAEKVHGLAPGNVNGKNSETMFSLVPSDDRAAVTAAFQETVQTKDAFSREYRVIWPDGSVHFLHSRSKIICDDTGKPAKLLVISMDISGQKRSAYELERRLEQMQVLSGLAEAVNRAQGPAEIYLAALKGLTRAVGSDRASVLIFDTDGVMRFKAWTGLSDEYRAAASGHSPWRPGDAGARPIIVPDVCDDPSLANLMPVLSKEGIRSVAFIPLLGNGGVIGKFMLYYDEPHEFRVEELQVAQAIAAHVAFAAERRQAEIALQNSEERFRATFFQAAVGITQADLAGKFQLVNDRFCQILGYAREELLGKDFLEITHPEERDSCREHVEALSRGEIPCYTAEKRYLHKNGSSVWARVNVSLVRDQNGEPQYYIGVVEDTTERIQAECALRESERRLTLALSAARLGVWECDLREKVVRISQPYAETVGAVHTFDECVALIYPDDRERMVALVRECILGKQDLQAECRILLPDGRVRWALSNASVLRDASGAALGLVGVVLDITGRKQAENALRESEELFRNLADTAPVMMWMSDTDKGCTFFNKTWLSFTGRTIEQELGNGWAEGIHGDDVAECYTAYCEAFDARRDFHLELRMRRADGEYRSVLCSGVPHFTPDGVFAGYIGSDIDITDLKRTQTEAVERQKLESLRVLTNGIAHDFNNLLGSVLADAELAEMEIAGGDSPQEQIQQIKMLAVRASEIVRELMIYSGQDQADLATLDLSSLAEEMLELLKVSISKHAVLKTDLPKNLPAMRGNAAQIRQVLMNLIINASEALGEQDGVIRIATSLVIGGRNLPDENYLLLEISDTGGGMPEERQARIFDPFFSTKFAGRGLGLAVVQGIVRAHAGVIQVSSTPGLGTNFEIYFPCDSGEPRVQPIPSGAELAAEAAQAGATLLFVDDEESLRTSVSRMLSKRGLSVLVAGDGTAAVELLRSHPARIDIILLDMTLPGTPSREIIAEAERMRPGTKIVLTSAYSREMISHSMDTPAVRGFIRKPFQFDELLVMLREQMT